MITVGCRTFSDADELEKLVIHAATEYDINGYVEDFDGNEVTDPEYDALLRTLRQHKSTSKAFKGTSPSIAKAKGSVVRHDPPMTSIDKADGSLEEKDQILEKWIKDCTTRLGIKTSELEIVQSYKHDGVALRVNYVKGKLHSAGLRPRDGIEGSDVTRHMKYIQGIPQQLPLPLTLSLNGEIECHISDFEKINKNRIASGEDPFKNPRNFTAGCMNRDDPEENKDACLRVAFYSITGFDDWQKYYRTEIERAKWCNSTDGLNLLNSDGKGYFVQVRKFEYSRLAMMEDFAPKNPYYTDGVVLKVNNLEQQEELGHTGDDPVNPPRGAIAWKFKEEEVNATIKELEWNASRTGRVVPTAIFETAVNLADTSVSRATVNNYGWATKAGVGKGTIVKVKKAGKIIPNVCGVVSNAVKDIDPPTNCPSCKSKLELFTSSGGNIDLLCKNSNCAAKMIHSWIFYITKLGGKGLGESTMEKILVAGKAKKLTDLYKLTVEDLMECDLSERQALLALATIFIVPPDKNSAKLFDAIENARGTKRPVEAWKFFAALGIPQSGETAGKALINHYKDFNKILNASEAELTKIGGIGAVTATSIRQWLDENRSIVDDLLNYVELQLPKSGNLDGKNFCLTGSFTLGKKHWQQQIEDRGGNIQSSVGRGTDYLVQEHGKTDGSPSDKEQKATKLNVPIISVAELEKLLK